MAIVLSNWKDANTLICSIDTHLEDVCNVSEVENVVEPNGCGKEVLAHFLMQADGSLDQCVGHATNTITVTTLLEMTTQNAAVYSAQSIRTREMYSKHWEMPLSVEKIKRERSVECKIMFIFEQAFPFLW